MPVGRMNVYAPGGAVQKREASYGACPIGGERVTVSTGGVGGEQPAIAIAHPSKIRTAFLMIVTSRGV